MVIHVIWLGGILIDLLVMYRAIRTNLPARYPFFCAFFFVITFVSVSRYLVHRYHPAYYAAWFWFTDFLSLILGCGIVLEIFKHALLGYRGARRFARNFALALFVAVLVAVVGYSLVVRGTLATEATYFELDRDFLAAQAIFVFAALAVVSYYAIPIGKNLRGIVLGYGFCVCGSLVSFALRSQIGRGFDPWMLVEPLSYDVAVLIWVFALWSPHPELLPDPAIRIEADYQALASQTRRVLRATRTYIERTTRL
jgi:hypothetical protein